MKVTNTKRDTENLAQIILLHFLFSQAPEFTHVYYLCVRWKY